MSSDAQQFQEDAIVERIADEFADRCAQGELPAVEDWVARCPERAEQLRSVLSFILQMRECGAAPPEADDAIARELGDYRIIREIGRGGMGIVYEAHQTSLGRRVALKVLPGSSVLSGRHQLRFELESRAAARLHHSHIVPVYGVGEQDGCRYYVMQLIDGCGLDEILREVRQRSAPSSLSSSPTADDHDSARSALIAAAASFLMSGSQAAAHHGSGSDMSGSGPHRSSASASRHQGSGASGILSAYQRNLVRLGVRVADALHYAHCQGVLHRDIKPSNLMLDASGHVWVMDFGLARLEGSEDLTQTGDLVGTLRYMAPERFRGESDARSDVYSLGLTLYELLLLQPAFDATDRDRLMLQLTQETPPRPRRLQPGFPRDLETILLKAIEPQPGRRYASADALRDDLQRYLEGRSILARRASLIDRTAKWMQREPLVAGLTTSVAVLMAVAIIGIAWQWREAVIARTAAESNFADANLQRNAANHAKTIAEQNELAAQASLRKAIETVDTMLTSVASEELNGIPRMDRVRRDLLEDALATLQQLLDANPNSAMLRFETAKACSRVSDICRLLGSYDDAERSSDQCIRLLEGLIAGAKQPTLYQSQLATTRRNRARLAALLGDDAAAEEQLRLAITLRSTESAAPDTADRKLQLAGDLTELATLLTTPERFGEAEVLFEQALQLCEELLPAGHDSVAVRRQLATTCSNCANLRRRTNQFSQADALHRRALDLRRALVNELPDRPELIEELAISYNNLGFLMRLRRRRDSAVPLYQKSLELRETLAHDFPDVPSMRKRLAFGCAVLARITIDSAEKERLLRRAFALRLRLTEELPDNPEHWHDLALAYGSLTRLLTKEGRTEETEDLADQLAEAHESYMSVAGEPLTISDESDETADASADVESIRSFVTRADELRQTGNAQRCLPLYDEAETAVNQFLAAAPDDAELLLSRARLQSSRTVALMDLSRFDDALDCIGQAVSDLTRVIELHPESDVSRRQLAQAWRTRGRVCEESGRVDELQSSLATAVEIRETLAARYPDNTDYQSDLTNSLVELARSLQLSDRHQEAESALTRAVDVCRSLTVRNPARRAWRRDLASRLEDRGLLRCDAPDLSVDTGLADLTEAMELAHQLLAEKSLYEKQYCHTANELAWRLLIVPDPAVRDAQRAMTLAEAVVALRPADADYQNTLGIAFLRTEQLTEARRALDQSVLLGGGNAFDFYALAIVRLRQAAHEEAQQYLTRADEWCERNDSTDPGLAVLQDEARQLCASSTVAGTVGSDTPQ